MLLAVDARIAKLSELRSALWLIQALPVVVS